MSGTLFKILWKTGSRLRNPGYEISYRFLKSTEKLSLGELKEMQFQKLRDTLIFASRHSEYYAELFKRNSFVPDRDFNGINDIKKIPVSTKSDFLQQNIRIHSKAEFHRLFKSESSGTSGQGLKFLKDEPWDSFNRASRARGFSWYGVEPWDMNGYFWGYNFTPYQRFITGFKDRLQNRFRIFSYEDDDIHRFARKLRNAEYLLGYSSMIYEVAHRINSFRSLPKPTRLKMVCGTSEKIFDTYQKEALEAYGCKIISEYGAAEAGVIAFECPHGNMHLNMEGIYAEEIEGEIIVTNLIARSFPVIRYKLGDYVVFEDEAFECPCGMKHPVIKDVLGRVGKVVYGKAKTYPSLTFYNIFKNLALQNKLELNYQAVQNIKGEVSLFIQQKLKPGDELLLSKELKKYFREDVTVNVISGHALNMHQGKFRDFISTLE
jgi:phenylacetate-CoA ligase